MKWISDYQLFLFDFDGLLVNTEEIHFQAYKQMCSGRGFDLPWDFSRYCYMAHYDSDKLKNSIYEDLPDLYALEPNWGVLYAEKKRAIIELLNEGAVRMMPGAEKFLKELAENDIPRCVVTNSPEDQIRIIKKYNPILNTIPHWFTRETYTHPKPHPECYLNAIDKVAPKAIKIIGFEDTPRGLKALMGTSAKPILISEVEYPEIPDFKNKGVLHFKSFRSLPSDKL
jgi:HAD superfamily hydrolase (TIGR01509 family)